MARFIAHKFKSGYDYSYNPPKEYGVITQIICSPEDQVLEIPEYVKGVDLPITHLAYEQRFDEAHEVWADWHHPAKGSDFVPDNYILDCISFNLPSGIKKVIIPATVESISYCTWGENEENIVFEVHPDNKHFTSINGKLKRK